MKIIPLTAALTLAVIGGSAQAIAQSPSMLTVIEHLNQSAEAISDLIPVPVETNVVSVAVEDGSPLATAFDVLGDPTDLGVVSVAPSEPAYGQEVFEQMQSE